MQYFPKSDLKWIENDERHDSYVRTQMSGVENPVFFVQFPLVLSYVAIVKKVAKGH